MNHSESRNSFRSGQKSAWGPSPEVRFEEAWPAAAHGCAGSPKAAPMATFRRLRVGGPATAHAAWVDGFIAHCVKRKVPVDFISTTQYGLIIS